MNKFQICTTKHEKRISSMLVMRWVNHRVYVRDTDTASQTHHFHFSKSSRVKFTSDMVK